MAGHFGPLILSLRNIYFKVLTRYILSQQNNLKRYLLFVSISEFFRINFNNCALRDIYQQIYIGLYMDLIIYQMYVCMYGQRHCIKDQAPPFRNTGPPPRPLSRQQLQGSRSESVEMTRPRRSKCLPQPLIDDLKRNRKSQLL